MPSPKFFFAWVDSGATFNAVTHAVVDEEIVSGKVAQSEGDFATLDLVVRNPKIGLLNAGRKVWAFLSWDKTGAGPTVPLFYGRLVAIPTDFNKELVTLQFDARPVDWLTQRLALAETLKVAPFWDLVYIDETKALDPDAVLEARTQLWHVDRITHVVTTSDLLNGEEGTVVFTEDDVPYDSVQTNLGPAPYTGVHIVADAPWAQKSKGKLPAFKNRYVNTKGGQGLINGWPQSGASIGGGWSVGDAVSSIGGLVTTEITSPQKDLVDADLVYGISFGVNGVAPTLPEGTMDPIFITSYSSSVSKAEASIAVGHMGVINYDCYASLVLEYDTGDRQRRDMIDFTLYADMQDLVTLPDDGYILELSVSSRNVGENINRNNPSSEIPIVDVQRNAYFPTDRGKAGIEYLLMLGRANLVKRARAVLITFSFEFTRAVELNLRKNVTLFDPRLPGGEALGKIIEYTMEFDGSRGFLLGTLTMGCAIGKGGSLPPRVAAGQYAASGYADAGWQYMVDDLVSVSTDIGYVMPAIKPSSDGLHFPIKTPPWKNTTPQFTTVETVPFADGIPTLQQTFNLDDCGNVGSMSMTSNLDTGPITKWLAGITTTMQISLKPITGGPFETPYTLDVEKLIIPKMIDLTADEEPS